MVPKKAKEKLSMDVALNLVLPKGASFSKIVVILWRQFIGSTFAGNVSSKLIYFHALTEMKSLWEGKGRWRAKFAYVKVRN